MGDPLTLTEQQAARTFSVLYEGVSEFSVTLKTGPGKGGRNFIFTGMSEVAYADVEECCPDHVCSCKAVCMDQAGGDCTAFTNQIVCPQSQCQWNAVENTCEPQGGQVQSQSWEEKCSIARCAGCDQCDTTTTTTTAAPAT